MAEPGDDRSTLVYALDTLAPLRGAIEAAPRSTIRHVSTTADDLGRVAIASLMEATQRERTVTLGNTLGQGGMGVVHEAEQVALGRVVAVKRLRSTHATSRNVLGLMREAWVTGSLEHPNIVPLHDVGLDAEGQPFLVMKRIEGEHWGRLIAHPDEVRARFGIDDVQGWHLGVLQQVCHAVAFAHSRDIVHRDLKPENVMVGAFGEVYLLDWGIAISLLPDPTGRLPTAGPGANITGTPAYMAPEMLGGELGPWSDVYLLGGLLYEILTGRAPHRGKDLEELLTAVRASSPVPPEGPDELVELCMQALDADPGARPPSAEAFRHQLARHLEHRQVLLVADEAQESLQRLVARIEAPDPDREQLWNHFGEVRFGFRQALKAWPEHEPSRRGLAHAVEVVARWSLQQGEAATAARVLAEDPIDHPELAEEVRLAVLRAAEIQADRDQGIGRRTRWFVAVVLASIWTVFPLFLWWTGREADHHRTLIADAVFVAMVLGLGIWARESLSKTALNRQTWMVLLLVPAMQISFVLGTRQLALPPDVTMPIHLYLWGTISWMVVIALEWRFLPTAVGYTAAWLAAATWPAESMLIAAISNMMLTANISVVWWPPRLPAADAAS